MSLDRPSSWSPWPSTADAAAFLARSEQGATREEKLRDELRALTNENDETIRFQCLWKAEALHKQAIKK